MDSTGKLPTTLEQPAAVTVKQASFEQRFAEALRRRLYPNTALRLKTLSRDTGYSEDTITRWTQAKHRVFAGAVEDLATYFASRYNDDALLREVFAAAGAATLRPAATYEAWPQFRERHFGDVPVRDGQVRGGNGHASSGEESVHL